MSVTLLYIEDDSEIGSVVSADLIERGYSIRWLRSGEGSSEEAAVQLTFLVMVIGLGLFCGAAGSIPWSLLLSSIFGGWVACLPLAALQLAISQGWSSFGAPLALNVSLTIPNMLIANSSTYGPYYPWVQPMLAMMPYGDDSFGAFNLPLESLMMVVGGSFIVFFSAGLISFYRKAV